MMIRIVSILVLSAFAGLIMGCSTFPTFSQKKAEADLPPEIRAEVKEALKKAPKDELSKSYDPLSLLKKAEDLYRKKNFIEASAEYEYFLSLHPLHRFAAYAQYRLALCYFRQIRTIDRDVEPALKARAAFQKLIDLHPDSPFVQPARNKIQVCMNHLARHEFYIGNFYYQKGAYPAAIARFEAILKNYPDTQVAGKALYYQALSHQEAGDSEKAKEELQDFLDRYPQSEYRRQVKRLLNKLNGPKT